MRYSFNKKDGSPTVIPKDVVLIDATKAFVNGATVKLVIEPADTGTYVNGTTLQASPFLLNMAPVSAVNSPGRYRYNFLTTGLPDGHYNYLAEDKTISPTSVNGPFVDTDVLGDGLANETRIAASGAVGQAEYEPTTSEEKLSDLHNPATVIRTFDMKDKAGAAAGENDFFKKVPQ